MPWWAWLFVGLVVGAPIGALAIGLVNARNDTEWRERVRMEEWIAGRRTER